MIFRTLSDLTTMHFVNSIINPWIVVSIDTLIFAYVFESKGQAGILPFNNSYFAKSAFAHHTQETEVVEVDCRKEWYQHNTGSESGAGGAEGEGVGYPRVRLAEAPRS